MNEAEAEDRADELAHDETRCPRCAAQLYVAYLLPTDLGNHERVRALLEMLKLPGVTRLLTRRTMVESLRAGVLEDVRSPRKEPEP